MHSLRQRINARDESGFTLIELLVVLIIIGVLLAIAVPSYLGFKDRAQKAAAAANVRSAIPAAEAYYSDVGSYTGMALNTGSAPDTNGLLGIDSGIPSTGSGALHVNALSSSTYCLSDTQGSHTAEVHGPGGQVFTDDQTGYVACP